MKSVCILDYGVGNLYSLQTALKKKSVRVTVRPNIPELKFDGLILPGVGSFSGAMKILNKNREALRKCLDGGVPVLGVCLGMQLLFERSEEGSGRGLSIFKGGNVRLPNSVKIPHMGWNNIRPKKKCNILEGIEEGSWVYFVHSYHPKPEDWGIVAAETDYGATFPSVISHRNIHGTQFHPEKSGPVGSKLLDNFLSEL